MEIQIHDNAGDSGRLRDLIKELLLWICNELKISVNLLTIIFTDDDFLKNLHRDYLQDDTFTDVMTFILSDAPPIESEIYIRVDRARLNAAAYDVSYHNEIMRLLIHACLHLAGYEDGEEAKRKKMKALENTYLVRAEKIFEHKLPES